MIHGPGTEFWRRDDPVLNEKGQLVKGGMWQHQRDWWDMDTFIRGLVAGYGAGKTLIGSKWAISMALQNAPSPFAVVSPTFPLAKKTVIPTIIQLLAGKESLLTKKVFRWMFNKTEHVFTIRYHGRIATIFVQSGEDPLSLRGPNLCGTLIDEPFIQNVEVFRQMNARIRDPQANFKAMGLTGTPEQLNWGYDLLLGEMKDELGELTCGFVQASSRDNKATGADYIKRLEGVLTGKAAKAYIDGAFVSLASGLVYYGFGGVGSANVAPLPIYKNGKDDSDGYVGELGLGMDFNVNPMAMTVFMRMGSHMHFFDEFELENADTEYACSVAREKYKHHLKDVYPDATGSARKTAAPGGKSDFWYIRQAGFTVNAPHENPKRKDRYNAVNGKFAPKLGKPTITVDPKCKKLVRYLSTYSHELMNKPEQKAMSHLLDAFGYPVSYLFPLTHGFAQQTQLVGH